MQNDGLTLNAAIVLQKLYVFIYFLVYITLNIRREFLIEYEIDLVAILVFTFAK